MTDASQAAAGPNAAALPEARVLLERIDWAALEHALGPAADIPGALRQLIDEFVNPAECTGADPLSCCQEPEPPF